MTGRAGSGAASFVRLHGRLHRSFTISNNHHIESILSISPCSIGKKRERVRSEIRDEGVPIPRPSSTKLIGLSVPMGSYFELERQWVFLVYDTRE